MKFRKRPIEIEAIEAYEAIFEQTIVTLEGIMRANPGDMVITGVNGEKYPCKLDIFMKTYEPADETAADWWRAKKLEESNG
jgi:hypothetical protein